MTNLTYSFSSPFIEERLYFMKDEFDVLAEFVLVPFYRGAVVFKVLDIDTFETIEGSRPLLSRSGCI